MATRGVVCAASVYKIGADSVPPTYSVVFPTVMVPPTIVSAEVKIIEPGAVLEPVSPTGLFP